MWWWRILMRHPSLPILILGLRTRGVLLIPWPAGPNAWGAEQGKDELMMHEDAVLALAWSRDSEMLATADQVQAAAADARHGRWGAGSSLACRARRTLCCFGV